MEAENQLVADLVQMARSVQAGLMAHEAPTVWRSRRRQIVELRQRIRVMRARHLGARPADGTHDRDVAGE
jgi:hypothetical protein